MQKKAMEIKYHEKGHTIIPDGYKWCVNCDALTPYRKGSVSQGSYYCEVCDNFSSGVVECPNCGCGENEEYADQRVAIKHHSGCHYKQDREFYNYSSHAHEVLQSFRPDYMKPAPDRGSYSLSKDKEWYQLNRRLKKELSDHEKKFRCGCPRFIVFENIDNVVIDSHGSWWRYKARCRVCGFVYENDGDGY